MGNVVQITCKIKTLCLFLHYPLEHKSKSKTYKFCVLMGNVGIDIMFLFFT